MATAGRSEGQRQRRGARRRVFDALRLGALGGVGVLAAFALLPGSAGGARAGRALAPLPTSPLTTTLKILPPTTFSVTVSVTGEGSVSSDPSGISCGSTCSASFVRGTTVTLTASPSSGLYEFDGWGGACSGTGSTCAVSSAADVTAGFRIRRIITTPIISTPIITAPTTYTLTVVASGSGSVTSSPSGISCPSTCSAPFAIGTTVTLHATPGSGFTIGSWSGDGCSGTPTTCSVSAGGTVTVTFAAATATTSTSTATTTTTSSSQPVIITPVTTTTSFIPPNLITVAVAVAGSGTVTGTHISCGAKGSTCFGKFKKGTSVTLHAGAATGFRFAGWSGGCTGAGSSCLIKVERASTVSARFTPVPHAAIVPIQIEAAQFSVNWQESVGTGKLLVHGKIAKSAEVEVELARSGGGKLVTEHLSLSAGPFSLTLKLEPGLGLLPGDFVVTIGGRSGNLVVPTQVKTLSLAGPPEGVVDRAFASTAANGPPTATIRASSKEAFVHFEFQTQPKSKQTLTISWFRPGGRLLGTAPKSISPDVTSSIKSNAALPAGSWRVDLRSGKTLVKSVTIQVR